MSDTYLTSTLFHVPVMFSIWILTFLLSSTLCFLACCECDSADRHVYPTLRAVLINDLYDLKCPDCFLEEMRFSELAVMPMGFSNLLQLEGRKWNRVQFWPVEQWPISGYCICNWVHCLLLAFCFYIRFVMIVDIVWYFWPCVRGRCVGTVWPC